MVLFWIAIVKPGFHSAVNVLWTCCEVVVIVVSLLWINFSFIWKSLPNKTKTNPRQCCNSRGLVVEKLFYPYNKSTTGSQHLQHVHNIHNMFKTSTTCSQHFTGMETSLRLSAQQSHNHYITFTTNWRLIPNKRTEILTTRSEFLQQPHKKDRIPATASQQHDKKSTKFTTGLCITTTLQQVRNKMILYGNQA